MTEPRSLVIHAPARCPDCGCYEVCAQVGEGFVDLHCGKDHEVPGLCGWKETHFAGTGVPVTIVTPYDPDSEDE